MKDQALFLRPLWGVHAQCKALPILGPRSSWGLGYLFLDFNIAVCQHNYAHKQRDWDCVDSSMYSRLMTDEA